jgi:glycyl-tRNA synthetase alpha chain
LANERQQSAYNFEAADTIALKNAFETAERECHRLLALGLILPAYEQAIGASHLFNLMDARGMIGVNERARTIGRIRALAKACCEAYTQPQTEGENA